MEVRKNSRRALWKGSKPKINFGGKVEVLFNQKETAEDDFEVEKDAHHGPLEKAIVVYEEPGKDVTDKVEFQNSIQATPPENMFFQPSQYNSSIKLAGRCYVRTEVTTLRGVLDKQELRWFETHPQFKHFFHMHLEEYHKSMGIWMLLLRTVSSRKKKELWFVVNGVPIRFSLREFALISGLNCRRYPDKFLEERLGGDSDAFTAKYFGKDKKKVTFKDVQEKLESMRGAEGGAGRLNIDILYFLASVIVGKENTGQNAAAVEPFFLKAASDLVLCKNFPWGRFAYDHNVKDIMKIVSKFGGEVSDTSNKVLPSFVLPIELLAFEAIPALGSEFREPVAGANMRCPKMCKTKWKKGDLKAFGLSDINRKIGDTKQIYSVLPASKYEEKMLAGIMDDVNQEADAADVVIDGWEQILAEGRDIFFVDMYNEDVESRSSGWKQRVVGGEEAEDNMVSDLKEDVQKLVGEVKEFNKNYADSIHRVEEKWVGEVKEFKKNYADCIHRVEEKWVGEVKELKKNYADCIHRVEEKWVGEVKELKKNYADFIHRVQELENMKKREHYDMQKEPDALMPESKTDENQA